MAKRFTDSDKWKDDWFLGLSNDERIVWQWLLDNCTHSGICKRSISLLNFMCRVSYTEEEMLSKMGDRVLLCGNIWFIPKFIKFQYSTLKSGKPAIISVVRDLFQYKLTKHIPESFGNHYQIISESFENHCKMIKDKDTVKDKDKDNECITGENIYGTFYNAEKTEVTYSDGTKHKLSTHQMINAATQPPSSFIKGKNY